MPSFLSSTASASVLVGFSLVTDVQIDLLTAKMLIVHRTQLIEKKRLLCCVETELEFVSVLHVLLRTFDLELADSTYDPALKPDVYPTLKAPMMMRVKRR